MDFQDATIEEIDEAMQKAWKAFHAYRKLSTNFNSSMVRLKASCVICDAVSSFIFQFLYGAIKS